MKRTMFALVLAAAFAAQAGPVFAAQDPSDPIYDENFIRTFQITLNAADWDAICNDGNGAGDVWKRGTMTWEGETINGVGIKRSGKGTAGMDTPKPSIRISFNEFEFDALKRKWRGINRIKLDSMVGNTDHSMMRDRVAYWHFRSAGAPTPRMAHCRLYVNGAFKGLYCAEEPVRKDFYRYRWGSDDDGNSYNQDGWGSDAYNWRGTNPGSYIPNPFDEESNWGTGAGTFTDIVELCNTLNNFPVDQIRSRLGGQINLDGFLRHLAVTTVYGDSDDIAHWGGGWCNNHFWYHHETGPMEIIKWDPGASQGMYDASSGVPKGQGPLGYRWENVKLTSWVKNDPTAWNLYKSKVLQLVNGSSAGVQSKIDSIYNQIRNEAYNDPLKPFSDAQFDAGKDWLKDWYTRRYAYLRSQIATNDATFVSQTVPTSMNAGQTYSVTVRMRNTGSTTWTDAAYKLGSQNATDNLTWGMNRVAVPGSFGANQEAAFTWTVTAPAAAGTYNFQWQMRESGVEWFGDLSPNVAVTVTAAPPPPPPPPTPVNNAVFVSQTVPTSMTAGQTYSVTVKMKNTGTTTWTDAAYKLGSQNPTDNLTWGMNRVAVPGTFSQNQEATFTWTVTAPATAGTYNFQWRMRESGVEWFGDLSPNVAVAVSTAPPPPPPPPPPPTAVNNAVFVSQTVPATMTAGQVYSVTVKMKNSGTTTWTLAETYHLRSQNPPKNFTWTADRADLGAAESIAPNQEKIFTWDVTAPATAGTYNFQWQMRRSTTDEWFGALTPNVAVTVTTTPPPPPPPPPPAGTNLAQFVSQTAPSSLSTGETFTASVTMRNAGTTTWTEAAQYRLSSRGPRDNTTWSINRIYLAPGDSVAPGQTHTFTFDVTAPATAGSYPFQWSMVQDGVDWFNDVTPSVAVTVTASTPPPPPVPPIASTSFPSKNKSGNEKCFGSIPAGGMEGRTLALALAASILILLARRRC